MMGDIKYWAGLAGELRGRLDQIRFLIRADQKHHAKWAKNFGAGSHSETAHNVLSVLLDHIEPIIDGEMKSGPGAAPIPPAIATARFVNAVRDALIEFETRGQVATLPKCPGCGQPIAGFAPAVDWDGTGKPAHAACYDKRAGFDTGWRKSGVTPGEKLAAVVYGAINGGAIDAAEFYRRLRPAYAAYQAANLEAARYRLDQLTGGALTSLLTSINDDVIGGGGVVRARIVENLMSNLRALGYLK